MHTQSWSFHWVISIIYAFKFWTLHMYQLVQYDNLIILLNVGLLTDIFNCVARTLTFSDFMAVFYGRPASLQRLRGPLQNLIRNQVLQGQPMNEENLDAAVQRIITSMQADIDSACVSGSSIVTLWISGLSLSRSPCKKTNMIFSCIKWYKVCGEYCNQGISSTSLKQDTVRCFIS